MSSNRITNMSYAVSQHAIRDEEHGNDHEWFEAFVDCKTTNKKHKVGNHVEGYKQVVSIRLNRQKYYRFTFWENNKIVTLPKELSQLRLQKFNCSKNVITHIPKELYAWLAKLDYGNSEQVKEIVLCTKGIIENP